MYDLEKFDLQPAASSSLLKNRVFWGVFFLAVTGLIIGAAAVMAVFYWIPAYFQVQTGEPVEEAYRSKISYEQAIIDAARNVSPSVVSIVISKNVPIYEEELVNPFGDNAPFDVLIPQYVQKGTKLQQVGAGSGFIVSTDGMVVTNKHVVRDSSAEYTVYTNDGKKYEARVLALDPVQDLAIIKIEAAGVPAQAGLVQAVGQGFPAVRLGNSSGAQIGQTVIAIGNALGQFSNSVSVGIISGLGRTVSASDRSGDFSETLEGIIQTDAGINSGNSGGPLVNLNGEVIGINTAIAEGAENIGFAIPIDIAKRGIRQVQNNETITYPFLGVRYVLVDADVQQEYGLAVDYGALVGRGGNGEPAITPGSAAAQAGLEDGDLILEMQGQRISKSQSLASIIQQYSPGDTITLKILREGQELEVSVTLGERS